ncbi:MAG: MFS transporter [Victivallaceae bacterium]|jgi:UMF1 family MFS transporter
MRSKKEIFGWAMFDFANQAYTLLITTVVFGDLFTRIIVGDAPDFKKGNLLWSLALAISYMMVVLSAPVCGAIMDYSASRKRFLFGSYILNVFSTAALYFVAPGMLKLGVILIIVSNFSYSIGEAFIASFLPGLGKPEELGKISGFGWAMGYVGGMFSAVLVLALLGDVSYENFDRIRWVGPWAGFFFLVAAVPTFLWVRERGTPRPLPEGRSYLAIGADRVVHTVKSLKRYKDMGITLLSMFFAMCGIYVVITYAFIYGAQVVGWEESVRTLMFITVQVTAAIGAIVFGFIQNRIGAKQTYQITLLMWIGSILLIFLTPWLGGFISSLLNLESPIHPQYIFLTVGSLAGLSLGSCQSTTRALVGLFAPQHRTAEFFGFWGMSLKFAGVCGVLFIGVLQVVLGLRLAILFCALLFAAALVLSRPLDVKRGMTAAAED